MLETTLDVAVSDDNVAFDIVVGNSGDEDVTLAFSDGQRCRVTVTPADGGEAVWTSDADRMFMQVMGEGTVPAGGEVTFGAEWDDPAPGEYAAEGEVTCRERDLTATATFSV